MKKIFFSGLIFVFMVSHTAYALAGWTLINEFVQPLIPSANSEDLGHVIYRTYEKKSPQETLEIILAEGKGIGNLYVPEHVKNSKGLMPASEYKILEVGGKKAIFEKQPYLPSALAVAVDDNIILNLESSSLNEKDLISIAEEILSSWKNMKSDLFPVP